MELLEEEGIYICPECRSKRITEVTQNALIKMTDVNTKKTLNPITNKRYMSNRDKAIAYDAASIDGVGCWYYECRKCGWQSKLMVE